VLAATPLPAGLAAGSALQIASGETGEAIDGATVTIGSHTYTSVGGLVPLAYRATLRTEVGVVAPGMLERRTVVRDVNTTRFTLWPPTGMDPDFTNAIVYTNTAGGAAPLRRLARGTARVVVIPSEQLRGDAEMAAHQEAADGVTAATGGQVVYVLGTEKPASGVYIEARIGGSDDPLCNETNALAFAQTFTRNGEIVRALIVYCDPKSARTSVASHEMGHTFGLFHSPEKGELMYAFFNGHGAVEFSARESLEMRLMLQRIGGNQFPDDDRGVSVTA
jgi:hypothetical protein